MLYYLVINAAVSACAILAVLFAWERYGARELGAVPLVTATAAPSATLEPGGEAARTATPESLAYQTYEVQPGDTLSGIAFQFGVTVEEIIALNSLSDPDALAVGDILQIPILVPAAATLEATAAPPTRTPLPPPALGTVETPVGGEVALEILAVVGAGELAQERVVIRQNGEGVADLQGWRIEDEDGNVFAFPQFSLFKGGAITVFTKGGTNSVVELYWGLGAAIWEAGEVVSLIDPDGNIVAAYQVP